VRAPFATGVAHEFGCGDDKEVIVRYCGQGDASSSPIRSDEIKCFDEFRETTVSLVESKGITENFNELGRYEVYAVSPQLKEELGITLIDSGSMVSLVKESSIKRFRNQREQI
jgi:hypothetical protein